MNLCIRKETKEKPTKIEQVVLPHFLTIHIIRYFFFFDISIQTESGLHIFFLLLYIQIQICFQT